MAEYIYLVQEREFIKTNENIYKIGKTKQDNLKRICNYPNGTIIICQLKCINCNKLEKELIKLFKEKYELQREIGNEYFKGNSNDMRDDIFNIIKNENLEDSNKEESHIEYDENIKNDEQLTEIKEIFPNYKEDECFGGKMKLIKIKFENNISYSYYINYYKNIDVIYLQRYWFQKNAFDNSDYISKLIENNVIQNEMIYDFNNSNFIKELNKYKEKINITYTEEDILSIISKFNKVKNNINFKIDKILYNNCILNNAIYCDNINNTLYIDFTVPAPKSEINKTDPEFIKIEIKIININNIIFDYTFLRKYAPYCMELKGNEYYLYNRDYQIIDKNEKQYSIENWNGVRIYFDGEIGLILNEDKTLFKKYIKKINYKTSNMICMNLNEYTLLILNLYK